MNQDMTAEEIVSTVEEIHDIMDSFKAFSIDTVHTLEHAIEERTYVGDEEGVEEATFLMEMVHSVYRRLVESERDSLCPPWYLDERAESGR